jgi:hypothetical protein
VDSFLVDLAKIARPAGGGSHAFVDVEGHCRGFVQIIWSSNQQFTVHRLWTLQSGTGNGSMMLRALCDLADRHRIEIVLKALPFGRKPYPMSREQLLMWYQRCGFEGTVRKMLRKPRMASPVASPLIGPDVARE